VSSYSNAFFSSADTQSKSRAILSNGFTINLTNYYNNTNKYYYNNYTIDNNNCNTDQDNNNGNIDRNNNKAAMKAIATQENENLHLVFFVPYTIVWCNINVLLFR
jgi:hypothetical protein